MGWEDFVYDHIRTPLFGRTKDIESFTFVKSQGGKFESIRFSGTFSGEQSWQCKIPEHGTATVGLNEFRVEEDDSTVIWVNVWNHLFGPKNNNADMKIVKVRTYKCSLGTRADVDKRYA